MYYVVYYYSKDFQKNVHTHFNIMQIQPADMQILNLYNGHFFMC